MMGNIDNNLIDRIDRTVDHLVSKGYDQDRGVTRKLRILKVNIEKGMIPGPADFKLLDFYSPKTILEKCEHLSPLGECRIGLTEFCKHRMEWEKGTNSCPKYTERIC